jgi:hypothetical protein
MPERLPALLGVASIVAASAVIWFANPMPAHGDAVDCTGRAGIDRARCRRHRRMAQRYGPIQGEAHFACDRDSLLAHPPDCKTFAGNDARRCEAEVAAFKTCEPRAGREFMLVCDDVDDGEAAACRRARTAIERCVAYGPSRIDSCLRRSLTGLVRFRTPPRPTDEGSSL